MKFSKWILTILPYLIGLSIGIVAGIYNTWWPVIGYLVGTVSASISWYYKYLNKQKDPPPPAAKIRVRLVGGPHHGKELVTTTDIRSIIMFSSGSFEANFSASECMKPTVDWDYRMNTYERDPENATIFHFKGQES